jgi:phage head maturation protease
VGVDPDTVTVGSDGIVGYVVVMTNVTGNGNAAFEEIRCATDEAKVCAQQGTSGKWTTVAVQE